MKDYSLSKQGNDHYILEVFVDENNTYTVIFADGSQFTNIAVTEDNLEKIRTIQEGQAKVGVNNLDVFRDRKTKSGIATFASGLGAAAISTGISFIPSIHQALSTQNPVVIGAGIGVITILGAIPAYAKFRKNKGVVKELETVKYRDKNRAVLNQFQDYPNSLAGVSSSVKDLLLTEEDPFSIIHIDEFTKEELQKIVSNIHREKDFQFDYPKEQVRKTR